MKIEYIGWKWNAVSLYHIDANDVCKIASTTSFMWVCKQIHKMKVGPFDSVL